MIILLMGVSGCGKSTIGPLLAETLGCAFLDADDLHGSANRAKMAEGIPLTDGDRLPWLAELRNVMENAGGRDLVVACSALKRKYRRILDPDSDCRLVYLRGTPALLAERLAARQGHFFNPILLQSQLDTLEEPEDAVIIDIGPPPQQLAQELIKILRK